MFAFMRKLENYFAAAAFAEAGDYATARSIAEEGTRAARRAPARTAPQRPRLRAGR
ncbi:MAG: hypothetical protein H0S85_01785 [Desulfovibrionaceae bacterium]|jgi:hypothetical protein|nr:hypothetical protein [Desulfovibrionaceae bacterium]